MKRLFEKIATLYSDDGFIKFQNDLVQVLYDSLGQGYSKGENEVDLVKRLVETAKNKSYGPIKLNAEMLHGSRSYVEFNYLDKPVTKELGDMAVISLVTRGHDRLFQRICIIQNKKRAGNGWNIDKEQLFLLKNFPPFTGDKGIFRGCHDMAFRNTSGCLGAFGLIDSPGEMIILSAPRLSRCLHGKKSLSLSDLSAVVDREHSFAEGGGSWFPFWSHFPRFHPKEWYFFMEEFIDHFGFVPLGYGGTGGLPFLGNTSALHDLYDFIRAWTQLSLGEITCVRDRVINHTVDAFSNFLMRSAGFSDLIRTGDNIFGDREFNGQMAVFVMHWDLEREKE